MRPDNCVGNSAREEAEKNWEPAKENDDRPAAWHAVFEELSRQNPTFHNRANTGLKCALSEIRRLYALEAQLAVLLLRNGDMPASSAEAKS